jgi:hypothetical protein
MRFLRISCVSHAFPAFLMRSFAFAASDSNSSSSDSEFVANPSNQGPQAANFPPTGDPDQDEHPDESDPDHHGHGDDGHSDEEPEGWADQEGQFHTMASHLSKLDSLTARDCADKFFDVHSRRWGHLMPRHDLHSARAGFPDVRESRKRKAANISRSSAESHAFCTSSNLSQERSDIFMESFGNVSSH